MSPDQQLQDAAQAMTAAAASGRSVSAVLKKLCPEVYRQIRRDGQYPQLLAFWGRSVNVDENAGQTIVHPAILQAIGALSGVAMTGRVVHAGLQHTYGYLFSLIDTPYGTKRERWVSTEMERGFGFDLSLLGERPRAGTLLANLTWFLGRIVYRDRPKELARLARQIDAPAPALVHYDYSRLKVRRIVEKAVNAGKIAREITLLTDLVAYPSPPTDPHGETTLLVYSVQSGPLSPLKLVTAFPVRDDMVRALEAAVPARGPVAVRPRYNAYVAGLSGRTVSGQRLFADAPTAGGQN